MKVKTKGHVTVVHYGYKLAVSSGGGGVGLGVGLGVGIGLYGVTSEMVLAAEQVVTLPRSTEICVHRLCRVTGPCVRGPEVRGGEGEEGEGEGEGEGEREGEGEGEGEGREGEEERGRWVLAWASVSLSCLPLLPTHVTLVAERIPPSTAKEGEAAVRRGQKSMMVGGVECKIEVVEVEECVLTGQLSVC